jgi:hypothetical protein
MYYGQELKSKDLTENIDSLRSDLKDKNIKIDELEKWKNRVFNKINEISLC